jgi:acetyl-CoA C-acetyltransferase
MSADPIVIVGAARTPMGAFQSDFASLSGDKGDQSVSITIGGGGDAQPYLSMTFSGL